MTNPVSAIGTMIGKAFDYFKVAKSEQSETFVLSSNKRRGKAVEYAEKYILRSKSIGTKNDSKLKKYEKLFFKYNN